MTIMAVQEQRIRWSQKGNKNIIGFLRLVKGVSQNKLNNCVCHVLKIFFIYFTCQALFVTVDTVETTLDNDPMPMCLVLVVGGQCQTLLI